MRQFLYFFSLSIIFNLTACQPTESETLTEKDINLLQKEIKEEQQRWDEKRTLKKSEIIEHHKIALNTATTPPTIDASFRFLDIPSTFSNIEAIQKNIEQYEKPEAIKTLCFNQHPLYKMIHKKNLSIRWVFLGNDDQEIDSFTLSAADCKK